MQLLLSQEQQLHLSELKKLDLKSDREVKPNRDYSEKNEVFEKKSVEKNEKKNEKNNEHKRLVNRGFANFLRKIRRKK